MKVRMIICALAVVSMFSYGCAAAVIGAAVGSGPVRLISPGSDKTSCVVCHEIVKSNPAFGDRSRCTRPQ